MTNLFGGSMFLDLARVSMSGTANVSTIFVVSFSIERLSQVDFDATGSLCWRITASTTLEASQDDLTKRGPTLSPVSLLCLLCDPSQ